MHADLKYADIKARGEEAKPLWTKIKEMQVGHRLRDYRSSTRNLEPLCWALTSRTT